MWNEMGTKEKYNQDSKNGPTKLSGWIHLTLQKREWSQD